MRLSSRLVAVQRCFRPLPGTFAPVVLVPFLLLIACGEPDQSTGSAPQRMAAGQPRTFPAEALRLSGRDDLVLAEGNHGIQLNLAEYNARVYESPLPANMDTVTAQLETLQRLVYHKVTAAEGRLRGYSTQGATTTLDEEIMLARQVLQAGMVDAQNVGDAQAKEYYNLHPDQFPGISSKGLDEPTTLMHVKFSMHNAVWRERLDEWLEREEVVVHRDLFEQLQQAQLTRNSSESKETR